MASSQEALTDLFVNSITIALHVTAKRKFAPGIVEITGTDATPLTGSVISGGTHIASGIVPFFTGVIGSDPYRLYLVIPDGVANGDQVKLNIDGIDHDVTLPAGAAGGDGSAGIQYDGDSIDQVIAGASKVPGAGNNIAGAGTGGAGVAPGQRAIVIFEKNPTGAGGGKMYALDPARATGIPLPAFRPVTRIPATGNVIGEAVLNRTNGLSFIWDGLKWAPIVPPSIVTYTNDTAILTDNTAASGTYAFSQTSGNLFVRFDPGSGINVWRQIGIRVFATRVGLLGTVTPDGGMAYATDTGEFWFRMNGSWQPGTTISDNEGDLKRTNYSNGTVGYATDTNQFWYRVNNTWQPGPLVTDTENNLVTANYPNGTVGYASDTNRTYHRVNGVWQPFGSLMDTQANILAATARAGQIGVATDTGNIFIFDGTNWIGQPFRDYPTEAGLLAATPADGVMAVAVDTGKVYYRAAGAWVGVGGNAIPVGTTDPAIAAAAAGDLFFNSTSNQAKVFVGGAWKPIAPGVLNDLADVDTTTPANDKETLVYDAANKIFKPGKGGGVVMGPEPGPPQRYSGMLWWSGARLFVWVAAANSWIEC